MTEGIFCLLLKQGQKQDKILEVQLFLARLLAPLSFAGLLCFYLVLEASALIVGLAVGLAVGFAIDGAEFIGGEVVVGLSGWL